MFLGLFFYSFVILIVELIDLDFFSTKGNDDKFIKY